MGTWIDRTEIERTYSLIRPYIRVTPVVSLTGADVGLPPYPLTLKLELLQHAGSFKTPDLDTLLVAVGGGGLVGGIAAWCAGSPKVVGVEPEAAPTLTRALEAGRPVDAPAGGIAADSLAPRRVGALMFPVGRAHIARVALVSDAAIRRGQQALWEALRLVAEPGGAAAFSALLDGAYVPSPGERVGVVVSGGNTTAVDFGGQPA